MKHGSTRWMTVASAVLVLTLVLVGEGFLLSDNMHAGTHFVPSGATLKELLHIR